MPDRSKLNLPPLTEKQLRDAKRDQVYIYNAGPIEHTAHVDGIRYVIPARPEGGRVSAPLVIDGMVYTTYWKEGALAWNPRDGLEIARELVGTFMMLDASQDLTPYGVFIAAGESATEAEIEAATEKWLATCGRLVAEGDRVASINGGIVDIGGGRTASNIGPQHLMALKEMGLSRTWSGKNQRLIECDQCGTSNMPKAVMCKGCDAVFNEAEARRLYPQKFAVLAEPVPVGAVAAEVVRRGPGRPPMNREA